MPPVRYTFILRGHEAKKINEETLCYRLKKGWTWCSFLSNCSNTAWLLHLQTAPWSSDQFWTLRPYQTGCQGRYSGFTRVKLQPGVCFRGREGEGGWGGGCGCGCGAESKGWDLLFHTEKKLMVDHRNSGSEINGVPRGQVVQWHPSPFPQCVFLPQSAANGSRWGSASVQYCSHPGFWTTIDQGWIGEVQLNGDVGFMSQFSLFFHF